MSSSSSCSSSSSSETTGIPRPGAVYIYKKNAVSGDWEYLTEVMETSPVDGDRFGEDVSLYSDILGIGAPGNSGGQACIVYKDTGGADNWGIEKEITEAGVTTGDGFGTAVELHQETLLVGAPGTDGTQDNMGAVYSYSKDEGGADNWGHIGKNFATDGAEGDNFGVDLAMDQHFIIAGAIEHESEAGAVYAYKWLDICPAASSSSSNSSSSSSRSSSSSSSNSSSSSSPSSSSSSYSSSSSSPSGSSSSSAECDPSLLPRLKTLNTRYASDYVTDGKYGSSVDMYYNSAVIGAPGADGEVADSGAVYVLQRYEGGINNWGEEDILFADDGVAGDEFGASVGIHDYIAAIGAPKHSGALSEDGAVYIFYKCAGIWLQHTKLTPPAGAANHYFGTSVAIYGKNVVVGADGDGASSNKKVYIYNKDQGGQHNWGLVKTINASPDDTGFGYEVEIYRDSLLVSVKEEPVPGTEAGSVRVFRKDYGGLDNWGAVTTLSSPGGTDDNFGVALSLYDDFAIIGANTGSTSQRGTAHLYNRNSGGSNNWGYIKEMASTVPQDNALFGSAVAIDKDFIAIGAPYDDHGVVADSGSVYIYYRDKDSIDAWGNIGIIKAEDRRDNDRLGEVVAISNGYVLTGVPEDNITSSATAAGSVRVNQVMEYCATASSSSSMSSSSYTCSSLSSSSSSSSSSLSSSSSSSSNSSSSSSSTCGYCDLDYTIPAEAFTITNPEVYETDLEEACDRWTDPGQAGDPAVYELNINIPEVGVVYVEDVAGIGMISLSLANWEAPDGCLVTATGGLGSVRNASVTTPEGEPCGTCSVEFPGYTSPGWVPCGGCSDGSPSMFVTITGNTDDVTWCGETWTPEESGETREVCPKHYSKNEMQLIGSVINTGLGHPDFDTSTYKTFAANEIWRYETLNWGFGSPGELFLREGVTARKMYYTGAFQWAATDNRAAIRIETDTGATTSYKVAQLVDGDGAVTNEWVWPTTDQPFGLIDAAAPVPMDGALSNGYFGSYTDDNGVTYSWSKGSGWDF